MFQEVVMMADARLPRLRASVVVYDMGDRVLVRDPSSGGFHTLDPTASLLWALADTGFTHREAVDLLMDGFGLDLEAALRDVETSLARLARMGVLEAASWAEAA